MQSFASPYRLRSRLVDIHRVARRAFDRARVGVLQVRLGSADLRTALSLSVQECARVSAHLALRWCSSALWSVCSWSHVRETQLEPTSRGRAFLCRAGCSGSSVPSFVPLCSAPFLPAQLAARRLWQLWDTLPPRPTRRQRAGPLSPHQEPHRHTARASALAGVRVPLLVLRP